jgi:c-di-GMP-binding flagellar brake protein YcgR
VDRRRHERISVRLPLYVALADEIMHKWVEIESQNVSMGGLFFQTRREIPLQAESRIMVSRLGGLPDSAQIEAKIVHCRKDAATGGYLIGVMFTGWVGVTPEELRARIEAWKAQEEPSTSEA